LADQVASGARLYVRFLGYGCGNLKASDPDDITFQTEGIGQTIVV